MLQLSQFAGKGLARAHVPRCAAAAHAELTAPSVNAGARLGRKACSRRAGEFAPAGVRWRNPGWAHAFALGTPLEAQCRTGTQLLRRRSNKVVVITGASAGVGRAAAREFALLARNAEALDNARAEVESHGRRGLGIPVDV